MTGGGPRKCIIRVCQGYEKKPRNLTNPIFRQALLDRCFVTGWLLVVPGSGRIRSAHVTHDRAGPQRRILAGLLILVPASAPTGLPNCAAHALHDAFAEPFLAFLPQIHPPLTSPPNHPHTTPPPTH